MINVYHGPNWILIIEAVNIKLVSRMLPTTAAPNQFAATAAANLPLPVFSSSSIFGFQQDFLICYIFHLYFLWFSIRYPLFGFLQDFLFCLDSIGFPIFLFSIYMFFFGFAMISDLFAFIQDFFLFGLQQDFLFLVFH